MVFRKLFKFAICCQYELQLAEAHKEYGKEKNHLCEGSSQLLHWCVLFCRLFTANQCHSFSSLFPNKCTIFHAVQLILAWQHSINKAVPCQTVNFFPFAHHLWILLEKQQTTSSGYSPRQAPEGNLTICISPQWKTQLENKKCICSLGAISKWSKVHSILLWSLWAGGKLWLLGAKLNYFEMPQRKRDLVMVFLCECVAFFFKVAKWTAIWWRSSSLITLALILSALPFECFVAISPS